MTENLNQIIGNGDTSTSHIMQTLETFECNKCHELIDFSSSNKFTCPNCNIRYRFYNLADAFECHDCHKKIQILSNDEFTCPNCDETYIIECHYFFDEYYEKFLQNLSSESSDRVSELRQILNDFYTARLTCCVEKAFRKAIEHLLKNLCDHNGTMCYYHLPTELFPVICISQDDINEDLQCNICSKRFALKESVRKLPCRHIYHETCLTLWLEKEFVCPTCCSILFNFNILIKLLKSNKLYFNDVSIFCPCSKYTFQSYFKSFLEVLPLLPPEFIGDMEYIMHSVYSNYLNWNRVIVFQESIHDFINCLRDYSLLSHVQIESLPVICIDENDINKYPQCNICYCKFKLEESVKKLQSCNHIYHENCLKSEMKKQSNCPNCIKIVNEISNVQININMLEDDEEEE